MTNRFLCGCAAACIVTPLADACSTDASPRAPGVQLTVLLPGHPALALTAAELATLPPARLTQTRSVVAASGAAATTQSLVYAGVLLRDVLAKAGAGADRGARTGVVEAVATDNYRAVYSWGELFNHPAGEQTIVVTAQDDQPLDAAAGPLALRSLGDLRPGPRHVRNLCALVWRPL